MAVYKKHYRGYDGPLTAGWSRFLVPVRYTLEDLNRSRFLTLFFLASLVWPLITYSHNRAVWSRSDRWVTRSHPFGR